MVTNTDSLKQWSTVRGVAHLAAAAVGGPILAGAVTGHAVAAAAPAIVQGVLGLYDVIRDEKKEKGKPPADSVEK